MTHNDHQEEYIFIICFNIFIADLDYKNGYQSNIIYIFLHDTHNNASHLPQSKQKKHAMYGSGELVKKRSYLYALFIVIHK
jgi:hypothetical protein